MSRGLHTGAAAGQVGDRARPAQGGRQSRHASASPSSSSTRFFTSRQGQVIALAGGPSLSARMTAAPAAASIRCEPVEPAPAGDRMGHSEHAPGTINGPGHAPPGARQSEGSSQISRVLRLVRRGRLAGLRQKRLWIRLGSKIFAPRCRDHLSPAQVVVASGPP